MSNKKYKQKIEQDVIAEEVGLEEVEAVAIEVVKKQTINMIISEWTDLPVLSRRIADKYDATIVSQDETCVIFEGESFKVILEKI